MKTLQKIAERVQEAHSTFQSASLKEQEGNKAAGGRARKAALELTKACKEYRAASNMAKKG